MDSTIFVYKKVGASDVFNGELFVLQIVDRPGYFTYQPRLTFLPTMKLPSIQKAVP